MLAVPVGARSALRQLSGQVDALVCVREMPWPRPVGEWYDDYPDLSDNEARHMLVQSRREAGRKMPATAGAGTGSGMHGRAPLPVLAR